jgi:hypothetical protein
MSQAQYNVFNIWVFPVPFSPIKILTPGDRAISRVSNTVKLSNRILENIAF